MGNWQFWSVVGACGVVGSLVGNYFGWSPVLGALAGVATPIVGVAVTLIFTVKVQ